MSFIQFWLTNTLWKSSYELVLIMFFDHSLTRSLTHNFSHDFLRSLSLPYLTVLLFAQFYLVYLLLLLSAFAGFQKTKKFCDSDSYWKYTQWHNTLSTYSTTHWNCSHCVCMYRVLTAKKGVSGKTLDFLLLIEIG